MTLRGPRVVAAELALGTVSLAVVAGFGRLFLGTSWRLPLLLAAVLVHVISALVRRVGLGIVAQIAGAAVGTTLLVAWTLAPETLWYALPTTDTWTLLGTALDDAVRAYPTARAPVEPTDGFVLASMVGVAVVALMADVAAFTLRAPLQALIPPFTLFVLGALLGSGEHRVAAATAFVVTALAFVLAIRGVEISRATAWLPGDGSRGPDAHMRVGAALIAVAAVAALVAGPALPGAADEPMWTWRGGGGSGDRTVISPLVDIQRRLVNQSRSVAFVVDAPSPSYWRMMSLDEFDGQQWRMSASMRGVSGSFSPARPGSDDPLVQRIEIRSLDSEYLPAAFTPIAIDARDESVAWDDRSATLLLDRRAPTGFTYEVESVLPEYSAEHLRAAPGDVAPSVASRYLQMPELDPRVGELAASVTAGAETGYDRALALQSFFRDEFEYSLEIPDGSGADAITRFLFEDRRGYCEQFAASFAAMARSLGLPARVAVGFTEGEQGGRDGTTFTVRGADAHAWPEVYFNGLGWVPFEPTPGRVAPGSEAWTGLAEDEGGQDDPTTPTTAPSATTTPTVPPGLEDSIFPPELDPTSSAGDSSSDGGGGLAPALRGPAMGLAAIGGWFGLVAGASRLRSGRRRRRATDPAGRIGIEWAETVELLAWRGRRPRADETYLEYAARVGPSSPATAPSLAHLAQLATAARFGPGSDPTQLDRATGLARDVRGALVARLPWWKRVLRLGDPRRIWATAAPTRRY